MWTLKKGLQVLLPECFHYFLWSLHILEDRFLIILTSKLCPFMTTSLEHGCKLHHKTKLQTNSLWKHVRMYFFPHFTQPMSPNPWTPLSLVTRPEFREISSFRKKEVQATYKNTPLFVTVCESEHTQSARVFCRLSPRIWCWYLLPISKFISWQRLTE